MKETYDAVWVVDFEFAMDAGESPLPLCMVAHEVLSGRQVRLWGDELDGPPPFALGPKTLYVAYYASAEARCHLALNWPLPSNVLDLYPEFRVQTNGCTLINGKGLLGAMAYYQLDAMSAAEKTGMRKLIMRGGPFSLDEREAILDYCSRDVIATERLLHRMWPELSDKKRLDHALLRGRYTKAVARMESYGLPIDVLLFDCLRSNWNPLKDALIAAVDHEYGVYEGRTFKIARFKEYLSRQGITGWPQTPTGMPKIDAPTFKEQARIHPQLMRLRELRVTLDLMRFSDLPVGRDGRNRCLLSMFHSTTGRNQPSTTQFIFGPSVWLRGLIRPKPGWGLAYIDWSQQEFGIAAALSGDERMRLAYQSGDPYLAFAKQAGAVPPDATKESHGLVREQFKACMLAVLYGMGAEGLAKRIGQPVPYAKELLRTHRRTYAMFWTWLQGVCDYALTQGRLWTVFGWQLHVSENPNVRSLCNFPMQANGAEMLRLACCLGTEAGIRIVAPVHDAVLIEAPLDELEAQTELMQQLMREAGHAVLGGFTLRSDVNYIRSPERYSDPRGRDMWELVQSLLAKMSQAREVTA